MHKLRHICFSQKAVTSLLCIGMGFMAIHSCTQHTTIKDLDETMLDLKIYQENMGDMIKQGRLEDAEWLYEGMDSLLQVINATFTEHRKLDKPFSYYYGIKLKDPMNGIEKAIQSNDTALAVQQYRILVRRCNGCHLDHDVEKEVKF